MFASDVGLQRQLSVTTLTKDPVSKCTTGCVTIDAVLRGGIPCGSITEIVGEASAGKSQLSLQVLLNAQLPVSLGGLQGSALYVYTEGDPPFKRLQRLAGFWNHRRHNQFGTSNNPFDNIYIEKDITTGDELLACLQRAQTLLGHTGGLPLRLIIIDSIANLFRDVGDAEGPGQFIERTSTLFAISALLKRYAYEHNLAVLVINQVSDDVENASSAAQSRHTAGLQLLSSGRAVVPALGLAWANCVNHRIFLSRATDAHTEAQGGSLRSLQVVFSPYLPQSGCHYLVEESGIRGLPAHQTHACNTSSVLHASAC